MGTVPRTGGHRPQNRLSGITLLFNSAGIFVLFSAVGSSMSVIVVLPGHRLRGVGGPGVAQVVLPLVGHAGGTPQSDGILSDVVAWFLWDIGH